MKTSERSLSTKRKAKPTVTITLTQDEVDLLVSALDSHSYWQLSDDRYRNSGFVMEPGSDDEDNAAEIEACDTLQARLREGGSK